MWPSTRGQRWKGSFKFNGSKYYLTCGVFFCGSLLNRLRFWIPRNRLEYCKPEPGELITNMHYINRIVFTHTAAGSARASPQQRSAQLAQCCLQRSNELLRHRYASICNALMKIQQIHWMGRCCSTKTACASTMSMSKCISSRPRHSTRQCFWLCLSLA